MRRKVFILLLVLVAASLVVALRPLALAMVSVAVALRSLVARAPAPPNVDPDALIPLPEPRFEGQMSVEKALTLRRSVRDYADAPLSLAEASQLLWAVQGVTDPRGFRTAPSAGATYPLELYLVAGEVDSLEPGVYRYHPHAHTLSPVAGGDVREELAAVALAQSWVRRAPASLVYTAIYERTTQRYGHRGHRYVYMEAGHAAQNVHLQAVAMDLGTVVVGAFQDDLVLQLINAPPGEAPLYIQPIGRLP